MDGLESFRQRQMYKQVKCVRRIDKHLFVADTARISDGEKKSMAAADGSVEVFGPEANIGHPSWSE